MDPKELLKIREVTGNLIYQANNALLIIAADRYSAALKISMYFNDELQALGEKRIDYLFQWIDYMVDFHINASYHEKSIGMLGLDPFIAMKEYPELFNELAGIRHFEPVF